MTTIMDGLDPYMSFTFLLLVSLGYVYFVPHSH